MNTTVELAKEGIVFDSKPDAIPYNYRISYKVSLLCLILQMCCGRSGCSLVKMHIIASALSDSRFYQNLIKVIRSNLQYDFIVRFDPALNRALEYSVADNMITQLGNGTYKLLEKGKNLAKQIILDDGILLIEKKELGEISINLTEDRIRKISEGWRYQNAENQ